MKSLAVHLIFQLSTMASARASAGTEEPTSDLHVLNQWVPLGTQRAHLRPSVLRTVRLPAEP